MEIVNSRAKRWFRLYTQHPKTVQKGIGTLSVGFDGTAQFFSDNGLDGEEILADMFRTRIAFVAMEGIMLSGFEFYCDDENEKKCRYQEWWLAYTERK